MVPDAWVPDEQVEEVIARREAVALLQMRLEAALLDSVCALDRAGIPSRVLKGLASAALDYPYPELRHAGDVDLLVPPDCLRAAGGALRAIGYEPLPEQMLLSWSRGLTMVAPNGAHVDLHCRLLYRSPRGVDHFAEEGDPLGDGTACALTRPWRLAHAAAHAVVTEPRSRRLSGFLDVALLQSLVDDLAATKEAAASLRAEAMVARGLEAVGVRPNEWRRPSALERFAYEDERWYRLTGRVWRDRWATPWRVVHGRVARKRIGPVSGADLGELGAPSPPAGCDGRGHGKSRGDAFERNPEVRQRHVGATVLLLEPRSDHAISLDGVGAHVWHRLAECASLDELLGPWLDRNGDEADARRDEMESFLESMERDGFTRRARAGGEVRSALE